MLDPKVQKKLDRFDAVLVLECVWHDEPAVAAFTPDRVVVLGRGFNRETSAPFGACRVVSSQGATRRIECYGVQADLAFADPAAAVRFDEALASAKTRGRERARRAVGPTIVRSRITTLPTLPGHRIVEVLGLVTSLDAKAGLTATMKGSDALDDSLAGLRRAAAELGANALVGVSGTTYGAAGGLTNVVGGDAVGVLLLATAVVVEPLEARPDPTAAIGESLPVGDG